MGGGGPREFSSRPPPPPPPKLRLNTLSRGKNGARGVTRVFAMRANNITSTKKEEGRKERKARGRGGVCLDSPPWVKRGPTRQQMFHPSPPLFFPSPLFLRTPREKILPLTTLSKSNRGGRDLIYRGGGISSFSIAAPLPPPEGEISTRYPSSNKIPP